MKFHRLGFALLSAYTTAFHTHLMSILPPTFARGFKSLCALTLQQAGEAAGAHATTNMYIGPAIWAALETLGLVDRYESLIASVGYEYIEAHVISTCAGKWTEPMLGPLRDWMTNRIVPWMLWPYARGASTSEFSCYLKVEPPGYRWPDSGRSSQYAARRWVEVRLPYEQNPL